MTTRLKLHYFMLKTLAVVGAAVASAALLTRGGVADGCAAALAGAVVVVVSIRRAAWVRRGAVVTWVFARGAGWLVALCAVLWHAPQADPSETAEIRPTPQQAAFRPVAESAANEMDPS